MPVDSKHAAGVAERELAPSAVAARSAPALASLLALDGALGRVLRTTREPIVGQMRLAWWREALAALDRAPPPAEPVLAALARDVLPHGVAGATLAPMVDGWERLLGEPLDEAALVAFAGARGGRLFAAAATALGVADTALVAMAGEGWALADLARNVSDPAVAASAAAMARERLAGAFARAWPAPARPLGVMALAARADLAGIAPGSPRRAVRTRFHRLTGR